MMIPIILLITALLVLLWQGIAHQALRALQQRAGTPYNERGARIARGSTWAIIGLIVLFMSAPRKWFEPPPPRVATYGADSLWMGMDTTLIDHIGGEREELVQYGRALIRNTAFYLGPQGIVARQTNGMNCQNCHLDAGSKPWGNNYAAVWSTYPKFRERSGAVESVEKRINDCFERSLNGTGLDSSSREMRAMVAYMEWLGTGIPKGKKPKGVGLAELPFLDRAADPGNGEDVYEAKCMTCHQENGGGLLATDGRTYQYPPLWGEHSYNIGAGLFRLSRLAGYVKNNMPQGTTWQAPQLTDDEAWDVAAYINSRQRPDRDLSNDWPKIAGKPVDHPFGPYTDTFPEVQHKFGPFGPIAAVHPSRSKQKP
ncbi:MAG: c-type cytochrome [Flavobacteriales bacterium]